MSQNVSINAVSISPVSISDARVLRDRVLRPDYPPGGSVYPGDDEPETLHVGAFVEGTPVAVATVCREPMPGRPENASWRLRGMATVSEYRGLGLGRKLAQHCIRHAIDHGGALLWCSSRVAAVSFYKSLGFQQFGERFRLPQFSKRTYVLMWRALA